MMDAVNNDMTGAMHQAILGHLKYIHDNGIEKWLKKCEEDTYWYPKELPPPHDSVS
jgi:hypothetical protein